MNDIKNILTSLNNKYDTETDNDYLSLYSKMSVMEFGGWIEVTFDEIWNHYLDRVVTDTTIKEYLAKLVVDNYGFEYYKNIQKIFCSIIGGKNWQDIISQLEQSGSFSQFKSILNNFSAKRNSFAHTTIGLPIQRTYDSPSISLNNYKILYPIICEIEKYVNAL